LPLPDTVATPTAVPPLAQVVGAVVCGPNTVNAIVPVGVDPPASAEVIELVAITVPAVPVAGPTPVAVVVFLTAVELMPAPQVLADALLLVSPP
jgi:hypothetical protein